MAALNLTALTGATPTIGASVQLASGDNTILTVASSKVFKVIKMILCNTSGAAVTLSVSVVPSGASVDATRRVVSGYSLAAGDTTVITEVEGMELPEGAVISVNASAGAAVNAALNGRVYA